MSEQVARAGANLEKADVVLRVEDLRKEFGGLVAADDASFAVERGTITGLIGPNGAGKSTLFNLVSGFYEPDGGSVYLATDGEDPGNADEDGTRDGDRPGDADWAGEGSRPGEGDRAGEGDRVEGADGTGNGDRTGTDDGGPAMREITGRRPSDIARDGLIRTFQTPRKLEGMTVREAMLVGPQDQPGESFRKLFTSPGEVGDRERTNLEDAHRMLEEFEIGHLATQPATDLSGGQMKLVELARAMLSEPEILLLDEPVAGVNPTLANTLADHIERLNDEGTTFLVIEHDMDFIMNLADPIIVLDQGSVLMEGSPEAVRADDRVIDAYLGGGGA